MLYLTMNHHFQIKIAHVGFPFWPKPYTSRVGNPIKIVQAHIIRYYYGPNIIRYDTITITNYILSITMTPPPSKPIGPRSGF
jgi:hypothetical protein